MAKFELTETELTMINDALREQKNKWGKIHDNTNNEQIKKIAHIKHLAYFKLLVKLDGIFK